MDKYLFKVVMLGLKERMEIARMTLLLKSTDPALSVNLFSQFIKFLNINK